MKNRKKVTARRAEAGKLYNVWLEARINELVAAASRKKIEELELSPTRGAQTFQFQPSCFKHNNVKVTFQM